MGQQSLAGFLGLHVDVDQVFQDNMRKKGLRKSEGVLINQGDKLRPEEKNKLTEENQENYGLSEEYLEYLTLPKAS